jgi:plastocyanin
MRALIGVVLGGAAITLAAGCSLKDEEPDLIAGKKLFVEKCGACHTLARAETKGTQGPNLDEAFQRGLFDGQERSGVESAVKDQIANPARVSKKDPIYMPADLVEGDDAANVAAYVSESVAKRGKDTGLLAEAVKKPGGGKPAVEENGVLTIPATAQLAYETNSAQAKPGEVEIKTPNPSGTPHNIALEGPGVSNAVGKVVTNGGVSDIKVTLKAGKYTFFCTVPGHREGGMEGQLVVK